MFSKYQRLISTCARIRLSQLNRVANVESVYDLNKNENVLNLISSSSRSATPQPLAFRSIFLPEHYPESVGPNFARYCGWLMIQNSVGSAAYVLSTHALLTSLGVGVGVAATAALPLATTVNWVLKDGLGSLGMIAFAARGGGAARFDGDAKVTKWRADVLFNLGVALELLTPLAPALFLPLASLANVAKGVGGLAAGASKAALHRALALRDNLGDVTAKLYSQGIAAYLLGMAGGIALSHAVAGAGAAGVLAAFGALTVVHLAASHRALRCVELRSLNAQRLALLARHYRATARIASPAQIARDEHIVGRPADVDVVVVVAPSLAAVGAADAAAIAARLATERRVVLGGQTLYFRHDYTPNDVYLSFFEAVGGEEAGGEAFAAALSADERWMHSVELIRIDNVIRIEQH